MGIYLRRRIVGEKSVCLGYIICEVNMRRCSRCKIEKPDMDFYKDKRRPSGLKSQCKACHCEGSVRTRNKDRHRDARRESMRRARDRMPEIYRERERIAAANRVKDIRVIARQLLNASVRAGHTLKPSVCQHCNETARLTGHHVDYSKPYDVIWLCYPCHGKEHRHDS